MRSRARRIRVVAAAAAAMIVAPLAACAGPEADGPVVNPPSTSATPPPSPGASVPPPALRPAGGPETLATGLDAPWSILRVPGGGVLVSERDAGRIVEVLPGGSLREVAVLPDVVPGGEGGLLGLAFVPGDGDAEASVLAYFSTREDNRIVRMTLTGDPGSLSLGTPRVVLEGIPRGGRHNGGGWQSAPTAGCTRPRATRGRSRSRRIRPRSRGRSCG
ncbi:hypothetical protein GCM10025870_25450 [Agromyces marinus]|uniref:Glucose/Sorbosone dehydrogenase domain-containing protein n=1 Tax=Agromyces marinus TaxID=1389020 RepID=A0ABN6YHU0_9MICO|nr:PQQ-dependent sugar dehydrogenase [Agromyces marinus]BDZ55472.1 hypothetical protein GCM10025870_25450 [Agromyces marinus]